MQLMTIGYGDIHAFNYYEQLISILGMICGVVLQSMILYTIVTHFIGIHMSKD